MQVTRRQVLSLGAKLGGVGLLSIMLERLQLQRPKTDTPVATLLVDEGDGRVRTFRTPGSTPLTLLLAAGFLVQVEGFPGGSIVRAIGTVANGQRNWHLLVNGVSPSHEGADYQLQQGDRVEWRYL